MPKSNPPKNQDRPTTDQPITERSDTPDLPTFAQPKRKPWLWLLVGLALIAGVLLGRYWETLSGVESTPSANADGSDQVSPNTNAASPSSKDKDTRDSVLTVETITPTQSTLANTLQADGTIIAKDTADVSPKVNGAAIEQVRVQEGDHVKQGQVLAVFDTQTLQQQVNEAKAAVAQAQATLTNANADAQRVLPLLDIDAISKQEADRYRTNQAQAQASLAQAKAQLNTQQINLSHAKVEAPVAGVISARNAEVGSVPGNQPLFTIIVDGQLQWQANVSPAQVGQVRMGTPVKVTLPNNQHVLGSVTRVAPTADDNRQVSLFATLQDSRYARAGMYQNGVFMLGKQRQQVVPASAVVSDDGYDYLMLVTNINQTQGQYYGQIVRKKVKLGERQQDQVAVLSTLPNEVLIVKQSGGFLNAGDRVRLAAAPVTTNTAR